MKQQSAGSELFTKMVYDGVNRETKRYLAYDTDESPYSDADDVTGDTVLEQIESTYDDASNVIQITNRQRYHTAAATQTGELQGPSGSDPKARVTYLASWHDGVGREMGSADYGTNGGSAFTRPDTIPTRSDRYSSRPANTTRRASCPARSIRPTRKLGTNTTMPAVRRSWLRTISRLHPAVPLPVVQAVPP